MRRKLSPPLAALVVLRAGRRCEYCHAPQQLIEQVFHFDHIHPLSAGGETHAENLCFACPHCNVAKSNAVEGTDPKTGKTVCLFNPRVDAWEKHFRWSEDWKQVIGRTAIGRATVVALNMNDKLLQEARYYWRLAGGLP